MDHAAHIDEQGLERLVMPFHARVREPVRRPVLIGAVGNRLQPPECSGAVTMQVDLYREPPGG